ncbi:MAG: hypothetical protein FGM47_06700, partial [Candidatus Nanopelagicaceae bacterium]|nr:hypothetical protein [Candidatus Nanopelagicaceae bacterium]
MSTKTTLKRIALVAVSALGFGLLSVAPSQATTQRTVSSLTQGTLPVVRAGVTANIPVTAVFAANAANTDTFTVAAKVISAPTGSAHVNNSVNNVNASGGLINITEDSSVLGDGTATFTAFTNASGRFDAQVSENVVINGANGTTSGTFRVSFTPDVAGTYQILVSANAATYTAGNPATVVTVTTAGAPVSVSVSALGRVVEGAPSGFGANLAVTLKDAAGLATILGPNEAINVTTSDTTATVLSASTLSSPSSSGTYTILVEDGTIDADGTAVITFTGSGVLPASLTTNITVTEINTGTASTQATLTSATGYAGTSPTYYTAAKSTHTFTFASVVSADTKYAVVVDATGAGARDYATSVTVPAADDTADFSVAQALSATGITSVSVGIASGGSAIANPIVINYEAPVANKIAIEGTSSLLLATGGSVK